MNMIKKNLTVGLLIIVFNNASFLFSQQDRVIISEVHYDSRYNEDIMIQYSHRGEFIELFNTSTTNSVNISGWSLSDTDLGQEYIFPSGSVIPPRGFYVVAFGMINDQSPFTFLTLFPGAASHASYIKYQDQLMLNNDGEILSLKDNNGVEIDYFVYRNIFYNNYIWNLTATNSISNSTNYSIHRYKNFLNFAPNVPSHWLTKEANPFQLPSDLPNDPPPNYTITLIWLDKNHARLTILNSGSASDIVKYKYDSGDWITFNSSDLKKINMGSSVEIIASFEEADEHILTVWGANGFGAYQTSLSFDYPPPFMINSIQNLSILTPIQTDEEINDLNDFELNQSKTYSDGMGKLIQAVSIKASPSKKDIINPIEYDQSGRQSKSYLAYVSSTNNGSYQYNACYDQKSFYLSPPTGVTQSEYPFSMTKYEHSPIDNAYEIGSFGETWQPHLDDFNGHTIKQWKRKNNTNEIIKWNINGSSSGYYNTNEIMVTTIIDENNNQTLTYVDKSDKTLLKISFNNGEALQTYYVYDDFGNLKYIIPPMAISEMDGEWELNDYIKQRWVTEFIYDEQNQLVEKKIPEKLDALKNGTYYVYDRLGRQILSQDSKLREQNQWVFNKYDVMGRIILSGIFTDNIHTNRVSMQTFLNTYVIDENGNSTTKKFFENRTADNYTVQLGYSNSAFPDISQCEIWTVTYYDDYDYDNNGISNVQYISDPDFDDDLVFTRTSGKVTGGMNRVMGGIYAINNIKFENNQIVIDDEYQTSDGQEIVFDVQNADAFKKIDWITSTSFYDKYGRVIQSQTNNSLGGKDIVYSEYDFSGKIIKSKINHTSVYDYLSVLKQYEYDHAGRIKKIFQKNNNESQFLTAFTNYNELGQILEKNLHSANGGSSYLQSIDFRYNIRGWLTNINNEDLSDTENDIFGMRLYYNEALSFNVCKSSRDGYNPLSIVAFQVNSLPSGFSGGLASVSVNTYANDYNGTYEIFPVGNDILEGEIPTSGNSHALHNNTGTITMQSTITDLNGTVQYNGNIAAAVWKVKNTAKHGYGYQYDALNQLKKATYKTYSGTAWSQDVNKYSLNSINYDLHGNILSLSQNWNGAIADDLDYFYYGNKLIGVDDAVTSSAQTNDFEDNGNHYNGTNPEYQYDFNGNMIYDKNKNITVTYNFMNLPTVVDFGNNNKIVWTYTVSGIKLRKTVYTNNQITLTEDYVNGFVYKNGKLDFFGMEEGRVKKLANGSLQYQYTIKDHLGNTRVMFADVDNNGTIDPNTEILQEDHYYAFGLRIEGLSSSNKDNKFTYNGKELEDDHGLNWYHYGVRYYDPALGRWHSVDPLDEFVSPYLYVANDPINSIDPDGAGEVKVRKLDVGPFKIFVYDGTILSHPQLFLTNTKDYSFSFTQDGTTKKYSNIGLMSTGGIFGTDPSEFFMETREDVINQYETIFYFDDAVMVQAFDILAKRYLADGNMPLYNILKDPFSQNMCQSDYDENCQTALQDLFEIYDKLNGTNLLQRYNRWFPDSDRRKTEAGNAWYLFKDFLNMDGLDLTIWFKN